MNSLEERDSIPGRVIPKTQKRVLDATLINTEYYKVKIQGKMMQSWQRIIALPFAFGLPTLLFVFFYNLILD